MSIHGCCWLARGQSGVSLTPQGYGTGYYEKRTQSVHRTVFNIYYGFLPEEVMHSCDVRDCYNPLHLHAGTHAENMADMKAKGRGRGPVGEAQHDAVLTEKDVLEIRRVSAEARYGEITKTDKALAQKYGVAQRTIARARRGETWRHLPETGKDLEM